MSNKVETSSSCKESVDVSGVEFYDNCEILDGDFHLLQLLVGAANDVIGPHVALIQIEQSVAVLDGFCEHAFLHVGAGPDEEGLPVWGVDFQSWAADADEAVDVDFVTV